MSSRSGLGAPPARVSTLLVKGCHLSPLTSRDRSVFDNPSAISCQVATSECWLAASSSTT